MRCAADAETCTRCIADGANCLGGRRIDHFAAWTTARQCIRPRSLSRWSAAHVGYCEAAPHRSAAMRDEGHAHRHALPTRTQAREQQSNRSQHRISVTR
jgi:hypothetical protein